jgi:hypothetical protein
LLKALDIPLSKLVDPASDNAFGVAPVIPGVVAFGFGLEKVCESVLERWRAFCSG